MMVRKGQAAMEFLMTYGWAILIVLAAIGALAYFGVLSPNKLVPERTTFPAPLPNVDNAVLTTDGTDTIFAIAFRNNKGVTIDPNQDEAVITISAPAATACTSYTFATAPVSDIANGDSFIGTFTCAGVSLALGTRIKADFLFNYTNQETGQKIPHTGSVDGKAP